MMNFEITDIVTDESKKVIWEGLVEYNLSKLEDKNPRDLGVYCKVDGEIKGGLTGQTHGNWLEIDYLWVSEEIRHNGIGSGLLKAAEEEAIKRNCRFCFLNTFGFQAPNFYIKYGYHEVFVLEHFPLEGTRHFYVKEFEPHKTFQTAVP